MNESKVKLFWKRDGSLGKATVKLPGKLETIIVRPFERTIVICPLGLSETDKRSALDCAVDAYVAAVANR